MESFLYWYTQNNKTVILFLSLAIGCGLIYFIYRIFFVSSDSSQDGEMGDTKTHQQIASLDKKISKIIDHQLSHSKPVVFTGEASEYEMNTKAEVPIQNQTRIIEMENELSNLKKELESSNEIISMKNLELNNTKEKLVEYQKTNAEISSSTSDGTTSKSQSIVTDQSGDQDLKARIGELEKKLQEYDIISDDIAELQSLRIENADLKSKIADKTSAG